MRLKYVEERFPVPFEFGKQGDTPNFCCGFNTGKEFDIALPVKEMQPLLAQISDMQKMIYALLEKVSQEAIDEVWYG